MTIGSNMRLTLEAGPGSDISECATKAVAIATTLGVWVDFDFNGVQCHARPDGSAAVLANNYMAALAAPKPRLQAWS